VTRNKDTTMSFVIKTARTCDPDPEHNKQVTTLALALFDDLRDLHGYGPTERHLLEIASRLHDIGWSRTVSGKHHKLSRDLILELPIPGLDKRDRLTCALIARYHTKAMPDASRHQRFASLDPGRCELVEWLAGILRIADGLDRGHAKVIGGVACIVGGTTIVIRLEAPGDCRVEVEGARKKQDLLERKTGRRIRYRC
jgi:exopolyphosphatase/guanosine-5'-triphosphate,3'-diphosphate pyrophosphatase